MRLRREPIGARTRTYYRRDPVTVGKGEKSIPIDAARDNSSIPRLSAKAPDTARHRGNNSLSASGAQNVAEFILIEERAARDVADDSCVGELRSYSRAACDADFARAAPLLSKCGSIANAPTSS